MFLFLENIYKQFYLEEVNGVTGLFGAQRRGITNAAN
jgi:hypothetical protein